MEPPETANTGRKVWQLTCAKPHRPCRGQGTRTRRCQAAARRASALAHRTVGAGHGEGGGTSAGGGSAKGTATGASRPAGCGWHTSHNGQNASEPGMVLACCLRQHRRTCLTGHPLKVHTSTQPCPWDGATTTACDSTGSRLPNINAMAASQAISRRWRGRANMR